MSRLCVDDMKWALTKDDNTFGYKHGYIDGLQYSGIIDHDISEVLHKFVYDMTGDIES